MIFLWQRKTYFCDTIDMLKLVHQDSLYLLMLKSYRIQENMHTPTSQCLLKEKFLVKEQILEYKFLTNNLNIVKCNVCLECHIQNNVLPDQESYTCKKNCKRKDNDYYLNNNLHLVGFKVNEDGSHKLDEAGKKIHTLRYHKS
jgi:hypothetical protein